jgi:hypothetical protein
MTPGSVEEGGDQVKSGWVAKVCFQANVFSEWEVKDLGSECADATTEKATDGW